MKLKFKNEIKGNFVRIYINDTLHVMFKTEEFIGIQSYINDDDVHCIEVYTKNQKILLEYDTKEKWKEILKLFDQLQ
jgi:hypothetical protein